MPPLPTTEAGLYQWVAVLMAIYVALSYLIQYRKSTWRRDFAYKNYMSVIFDAATFAVSVLLFLGVAIEPEIITALGSPKPFLLVAALGGIAVSIRALG